MCSYNESGIPLTHAIATGGAHAMNEVGATQLGTPRGGVFWPTWVRGRHKKMVGKPRHKHLNKGTRNTQGAAKSFFLHFGMNFVVLIWNFWAPKQNEYRWEILEIVVCSIPHLEMWSKSLSDRSEYHFLCFTGHLSKHFVKRCLEPSNTHPTLSVHTTNKMHVHPTCRFSAEKYLPGNSLWPFLGWSGDPFKG